MALIRNSMQIFAAPHRIAECYCKCSAGFPGSGFEGAFEISAPESLQVTFGTGRTRTTVYW